VSVRIKTVATIEFESNLFPVSHWKRLKRFAIGNERDPRGLFRLADDKWDAWPYAVKGMPSQASQFRFHFSRLRSFLKPYVKLYCYQMLLGKSGNLHTSMPRLPSALVNADRYISELGFRSVDDIATLAVFQALWDAQLKHPVEDKSPLPSSAVYRQKVTYSFWRRMRAEFGVPFIIPPISPSVRAMPGDFAADRSKLIPEHVTKRLANKLALHREGKEILTRFDHLRLCVLMLLVCLGRRINEVLLSPRRAGPEGPLSRHPSQAGPSEGSLWFRFTPNKEGPDDRVFISPEWEELALYCVTELVNYSDEVRHLAVPEERGLLILVSPANMTYGRHAKSKSLAAGETFCEHPKKGECRGNANDRAYGLKYVNFTSWLNGIGRMRGALTQWGITADGSESGPIYRFLTSYCRHTRQSALAIVPQISPLARQQDLNHRNPDTQFAYQHRLRENNDSLLEKIKEGKLVGRGVEWLMELFDVETQASSPRSVFKPGRPSPITPRMRALVRNSPTFLQQNRVPPGICILPQGPCGCADFLHCTSAREGGCNYFVVDVSDARMLHELDKQADEERRLHQESVAAGRVVQAQKRATLARRTEDLRDEAMRRASEVTLADLRKLQSEIEGEGL
jgi:hypothetical protein